MLYLKIAQHELKDIHFINIGEICEDINYFSHLIILYFIILNFFLMQLAYFLFEKLSSIKLHQDQELWKE